MVIDLAISGSCGTPQDVIAHYRQLNRYLKANGLKRTQAGHYVGEKTRIAIKILKCDDEFWILAVNSFGSNKKSEPKKLTELTKAKVLNINRYGKLCRIPLKDWDFSRPSKSLSRM